MRHDRPPSLIEGIPATQQWSIRVRILLAVQIPSSPVGWVPPNACMICVALCLNKNVAASYLNFVRYLGHDMSYAPLSSCLPAMPASWLPCAIIIVLPMRLNSRKFQTGWRMIMGVIEVCVLLIRDCVAVFLRACTGQE
jgi:hypothetical protein